VTAPALVAALAKAHAEGRLEERLGFFASAHLFFQLISRRYERGSVLITSNRSVGEWGSVFGDPVVATAILDRLLHHSHVITIPRRQLPAAREAPFGADQNAGFVRANAGMTNSGNLDRGSPTGAHRNPPVDSVDDPLRRRRHNH
jgi:hypothetical protein